MWLIKASKSLQWNPLYPLPAIAAVLLFIFFIAYILVRNRDERKKRYVVFGLWLSCAFGFAAAQIPMMVG
ncbi:hypothetical protein IQ06DRAFT_291003 [Phaeosphaeriaceae sp. SRC1lsM3a]|nr:hypothetical protein IQ06DRAFT_291003 [Stagonospora sp. SRC1lsM3a]